ncbi:replication factor A protein 3 [Gloeophyllum trabeum ATCC 11539]|uniref:Replication factor A protein 3 n=1 Tax=Gloeophyllum trabeum (strain ATCC 11539 / FP-39264 / Madison 617) TaxID=670483 RepID=S7RI22_GLOTA|nr:replication factor A protein 3 [Gloeophyllum trabeum ATCC 11539]EPQ52254.1 replication factor A protein 3 [Gloeophyllum trabeum ATCC 11539]
MAEHTSTRVNSAKMPQFVGRTVRLVCKVLQFKGDTALVEASDGGQVEVRLPKDANVTDTYVEIIGKVIDASTLQMMACVLMGDSVDMKLIDDVVNMIHDPRFMGSMF